MVLHSLGRKCLNLRPRDMEALEALYHSGIIAAGHLVRLFWGGRSYGYLRLRMLADAGYVTTLSFQESLPGKKRKKRKLTSFYCLSSKGTAAVASLLDAAPCPHWKNRPAPERFYDFWHMGELWCRLWEGKVLASPRQWLAARPAKKMLRLAAYAPLHAVITSGDAADQRPVVLYYLRKDASMKRINMLKNFLPRIDVAGIKKHFIVCAEPKMLRQALHLFTKKFPERNIHVLSWQNAGEVLAAFLRDQQVFYDELAERLKRYYGTVRLQPAALHDIAPCWFAHGSSRIQVAELISGHLETLARLLGKGSGWQPDLLFLYVPEVSYYHAVKQLLPQNLSWLRIVVRSRRPGEDIFKDER